MKELKEREEEIEKNVERRKKKKERKGTLRSNIFTVQYPTRRRTGNYIEEGVLETVAKNGGDVMVGG